MKLKQIFAALLILSLLAACAQSAPGTTQPPGSQPGTPTGQPYPPNPTPSHIPVDLTPAQRGAIEALSSKYNIPVEQIKIVSTEAKQWSDSCLGVAIPGVMCAQHVVEGFLIILTANGQEYEYHTDQDGSTVIDAAEQLSSIQFVVYSIERSIAVVNPNLPIGPTYNPAFNGFLPAGAAHLGTAYVLDFTNQPRVVAVSATGQQDLGFIHDPNYGLALWRGGPNTPPWLAWGTQPRSTDNTTSLIIAHPDGTALKTVLTLDSGTDFPIQLVAEFWSMDGQSLYFSKEPAALGGYILFAGASNLYKIDINTLQVSELIPQVANTSPQACLDAISGDFRYVADHCTQNVITIRDLETGGSTTIQAPADVIGYRMLGSARFSPAGNRVAFALAQGDPTDERGWVAVVARTGGKANLVAVAEAGSYYTVQGWLDDQTLLIQSNTVVCNPTCGSQLFTVNADGANLRKVADGSLLTIMDNR